MASCDYIVSLSEQAFFTVVSSALEAFAVPHGDGSGEEEDVEDDEDEEEGEPLETYGNLWGYKVETKRDETVYHVSLADVDTSATRLPGEVTPNPLALKLKEDLVDHLRPELRYLGNFHAHPYHYAHHREEATSALRIEKNKRHDFSRADFALARHLMETFEYRIGVVATIHRGRKHVRRKSKYIGEDNASCLRFSYGELTIWLKCYVFDDKEERVRDGKVVLLCPAIGFHAANIDKG